MAKEVRRTFDAALGAMIVEIEDDFGVHSIHTVHVTHNHELCPACGRRLERGSGGEVDVNKVVGTLISESDTRSQKLVATFEKHGADMTAVKAKGKKDDRPAGDKA